MATIRDLERVLGSESPEMAEERRKRLTDAFSTPTIEPEVLRWQIEKDAAPVATRDAVLALIEEGRAQARWGRRMFWLTALSVAVAIANIAVFLAR
jgi:hypothetical protein